MTNVSGFRFNHTKAFAQYIIEQKLIEAANMGVQLMKDYRLPLLRFFKSYSKEDLLHFSRNHFKNFLNCIVQNCAGQKSVDMLLKWKEDKIPGIKKEEIDTADILLINTISKQILFKLLPFYNIDALTSAQIITEIENFFLMVEKYAFDIYMSVKQEELKNKNNFLGSIINNSVDGIFAIDHDFKITEWNTVFENWGYANKGNAVGRKIYEVFKEFGGQLEINYLLRVLQGEKILIHDRKFLNRNGWYEANLVPILAANDEISGALCIIHEITRRKQNESQLKSFQVELQSANEELQHQQEEISATNVELKQRVTELEEIRQVLIKTNDRLVEAQQLAQLGFWEWNVQKDVAYWSEEMFHLLGYHPGERIDVSLSLYLDHSLPEDVEWIKDKISQAVHTLESYSYEHQMIKKDGNLVWVQMNGKPFLDDHGQLLMVKGTALDITEKKIAYNNLAENEWKLRESQKLAHLGNWELEITNKKRVYWSEELYNIFGIQEGINLELEQILSFILQEDRALLTSRIETAIKENKPYSLEFKIRRSDGQVRHLYSKGVPQKNENGEVVKIKGFSQDITEQKVIEEELREKQHLIEKITENFPDVLTVFDLIQKKTIYSNKELLEILNYSPEFINEALNKGAIAHLELIHPEDLSIFYELHSYYSENKDASIRDIEYRIKDAKNAYRWIRARYNVFKRSAEGYPIQVIGVLQDESDQKNAELEASDSNRFIEKVTNSAPLIIYVLDVQSMKILFMNKQLENLLGFGFEVLQDFKYHTFEELVHPDDRNTLLLHFEDMKRLADGEVLQAEYRIKHANGTWRWFSGLDTVFKRDDDGKVVQIVGNAKDVTRERNTEENLRHAYVDLKRTFKELVNTEKQLVKLNNELEERVRQRTSELLINRDELKKKNIDLIRMNEYMDNFVYAAAHDLKSPVANLKLLTDVIKKPEMAHNRETFIDAMGHLVNRLDHTLKGLVQIIEVQSDKSQPASNLLFSDILEKVKEELPNEIIKAEPSFRTDFNEKPEIIYPEPFLLSIIRNMVSNSLKYRSSRRPLKISMKTRISNGYILLLYKDNGIGIDLEKFGKTIFHPFRRFSEQAEGTGIGLHLVKSMIVKNGGKIKVTSQPNRGITFFIYLKEYLEEKDE